MLNLLAQLQRFSGLYEKWSKPHKKHPDFKAYVLASHPKMLDGHIEFLAEFGSTVKPNCNEQF